MLIEITRAATLDALRTEPYLAPGSFASPFLKDAKWGCAVCAVGSALLRAMPKRPYKYAEWARFRRTAADAASLASCGPTTYYKARTFDAITAEGVRALQNGQAPLGVLSDVFECACSLQGVTFCNWDTNADTMSQVRDFVIAFVANNLPEVLGTIDEEGP